MEKLNVKTKLKAKCESTSLKKISALAELGAKVEGKRQQLFYYSCLIDAICSDFDRELSEFAEND